MYFRLAMRNVKKSFKDYLIYFLTLAFSVCLFYSFNSFQDQQALLELSTTQSDIIKSLNILMQFISVIVAITLAFLIKYANSFLIKRRKKEFGLYTLLGMPKGQITRMLIYETFIVGMVSLFVGIIAGIMASQCLTVVTANLFDVVLNYEFVYSSQATLITIVAFGVIFLLIMFFNSISLNRFKLIDLLTADRKNETLKVKNIYVSVILFLVACGLLGFAYYRAYIGGMQALSEILIIAPCGIIGTILFFMSLSGFLLKFVQCSKSLYYKRLNMFVLRQVNASINSNFMSMSIVCIMLLFSIGALATGANLNKTINSTIALSTVYDYTYADFFEGNDISNIKTDLTIDTSRIKDDFFVREYVSDTPTNYFQSYFKESSSFANVDMNSGQYVQGYEVLPLSSLNRLRADKDLEPITLAPSQAYMFTSIDQMSSIVKDILSDKPQIPLFGGSVQIVNDTYDVINLGTQVNTGTFIFGVVINDNEIPSDAKLYSTFWNVNVNEEADIQPFTTQINGTIEKLREQNPEAMYRTFNSNSRIDVYENSKGVSVIMTYVGIYLGIIFLIASAVILALQQLSQASDSRQRYVILNKIGAEKRMIGHSVLLQLCIYFFMPLLLGIVHSIFGIHVVNQLVMAFGIGDLFGASMITGAIILSVYGAYFLITYYGYKRIIAQS